MSIRRVYEPQKGEEAYVFLRVVLKFCENKPEVAEDSGISRLYKDWD